MSDIINKKELQDLICKIQEIFPREHLSDYAMGAHYVISIMKRYLDGKDPFNIDISDFGLISIPNIKQ